VLIWTNGTKIMMGKTTSILVWFKSVVPNYTTGSTLYYHGIWGVGGRRFYLRMYLFKKENYWLKQYHCN
jgi:hypothetical protein